MDQDNTKVSLTQDSVNKVILDAYNRHLKRANGNKLTAWDMTYHFLKHMGYDDPDWERIDKTMAVMKEAIHAGLRKEP